jgi:hypothetical protein
MALDFVEKSHLEDREDLWVDVVQHSLRHPDFLAKLLDYLGVCGLNPISLIAGIDRRMEIPHLRERLMRIVTQYTFQVALTDSCKASLEDDTLSSLRSLNQSRRRAVRVEPTLRCGTCARPLFMPPPPRIVKLNSADGPASPTPTTSTASAATVTTTAPTVGVGATATLTSAAGIGSGAGGKIWGNPGVGSGCPSGAVVYAHKQAYHRVCFDVRGKLKK